MDLACSLWGVLYVSFFLIFLTCSTWIKPRIMAMTCGRFARLAVFRGYTAVLMGCSVSHF